MITLDALSGRLSSAGLSAVMLSERGDSRAVVVPELGAKVLGAGVDEENLLWVPEDISRGAWCVGGQRSWVAPELGPRGFFGRGEEAWDVPPQLDPGRYVAAPGNPPGPGGSRAAYGCAMSLRRADGSAVHLILQREISLLPPEASLPVPALRLLVRHALVNRGAEPLDRDVGLWSILQVPSDTDGTILIPFRSVGDEGLRLYFGELPPDWLRRATGLLLLRARAGRRWKVGFPPTRVLGVLAFLRPCRSGPDWSLIVQRSAVPPEEAYVDGPPAERGPGDALQAYNHPDPALPFSELECHAPARVLRPGGRQAAVVEYLLLKGPREELLAIAASDLGVPIEPGLLFP